MSWTEVTLSAHQVLEAHANGAQIQVRPPTKGRLDPQWLDIEPGEEPHPERYPDLLYRVKPADEA